MKVFLTGGTGFIGKSLTRQLLGKGWEVLALARKPDGPQAKALAAIGARLVPGDVTDSDSMRSSIMGADLVIHNAAHYELGINAASKARMEAINIQGTENVLGLAHEGSVPRTVYVSSVVAKGESTFKACDETYERCAPYKSIYEKTKSEAHAIALDYAARGLPLIIVCPNGVIGPNDHSPWGYFLRMYLNKVMPPLCWEPDSIWSLVEVNDLARGVVLAAEKGRLGETYFFAGESKNRRQHLSYWFEREGLMRTRIWVPDYMAKLTFWPFEPLQRALGLPAFISRETVSASTPHFNYSSLKAQRELGWSHMSAAEMWSRTIDGELTLLKGRKKRDLVSRLNPLAE
jgi:dihydroflavonol-4-reductase